jgi:hypothetical protein
MNRKSFRVFVVGTVSTAVAAACLSQLQAEDPKQDQTPEIVKAAQDALKATEAEYAAERAKVEDVYTWSRRVMEEELKHGTNPNAAGDHVHRMQKVAQKAEALYRKGSAGGSATKFHATRYYHLKARMEGKVPNA